MMSRWGEWDPRSGADPPGGWDEYADDPEFVAHLSRCDSSGLQDDHRSHMRCIENEHKLRPFIRIRMRIATILRRVAGAIE
jgi:hypothetical protein